MTDYSAVKAVIFDNDGTLVDTYDLILASFRYATREVLGAVPSEEKLMAKVGQPLATQVKDFTDDEALQERLLTVYREHNHKTHDEAIAIYPEVPELLRRLHDAGYKMGVVTSKKRELASHGLELFDILKYMDFVIGCDECPQHKPDPAPVALGCEMLGLAPQHCIYVGDSPFDLQAANGAGCISAAALWGMFPREVLEAEHPALVLEKPLDLLEYL